MVRFDRTTGKVLADKFRPDGTEVFFDNGREVSKREAQLIADIRRGVISKTDPRAIEFEQRKLHRERSERIKEEEEAFRKAEEARVAARKAAQIEEAEAAEREAARKRDEARLQPEKGEEERRLRLARAEAVRLRVKRGEIQLGGMPSQKEEEKLAEKLTIATQKPLTPARPPPEDEITEREALRVVRQEDTQLKREGFKARKEAFDIFKENERILSSQMAQAKSAPRTAIFGFTSIDPKTGKETTETVDSQTLANRLVGQIKQNARDFKSNKLNVSNYLSSISTFTKEKISAVKKSPKLFLKGGEVITTVTVETPVVEEAKDTRPTKVKVNTYLTNRAENNEKTIEVNTKRFEEGKTKLKDPKLGVAEGFKVLGVTIKSGINLAWARAENTVIGKSSVREGVSKGIEDAENISKIVLEKIKEDIGITKTKANEWIKIINTADKILDETRKETGTPVGILQINTFKKRMNELKKNIEKLAATPAGQKIITNVRNELKRDKALDMLGKSQSLVELLTKELTGKKLTGFQFIKEVDEIIKKAPANVIKNVVITAFPKTDFSKVAPATIKRNLSIFLEAKTKKGKAAATEFLNRKTKSAIETGGIVGFTERAFLGAARSVLELPQSVRELEKAGVEVSKMSKEERNTFLALLAKELPKATLQSLTTPEGLGSFVIGWWLSGKLTGLLAKAIAKTAKTAAKTKIGVKIIINIKKSRIAKQGVPELDDIVTKTAKAFQNQGKDLPKNLDASGFIFLTAAGDRAVKAGLKEFQIVSMFRAIMREEFKKTISSKNLGIITKVIIRSSKTAKKGKRLFRNLSEKNLNKVDDFILRAKQVTLRERSLVAIKGEFAKTPEGDVLALKKIINERFVSKKKKAPEFLTTKQIETILIAQNELLAVKIITSDRTKILRTILSNLSGRKNIDLRKIKALDLLLTKGKIRTKDVSKIKNFVIGKLSTVRKAKIRRDVIKQVSNIADVKLRAKLLKTGIIRAEKKSLKQLKAEAIKEFGARAKALGKLNKKEIETFLDFSKDRKDLFFEVIKLKGRPIRIRSAVLQIKKVRNPGLILDRISDRKIEFVQDFITFIAARKVKIVKGFRRMPSKKSKSLIQVLREEKQLADKIKKGIIKEIDVFEEAPKPEILKKIAVRKKQADALTKIFIDNEVKIARKSIKTLTKRLKKAKGMNKWAIERILLQERRKIANLMPATARIKKAIRTISERNFRIIFDERRIPKKLSKAQRSFIDQLTELQIIKIARDELKILEKTLKKSKPGTTGYKMMQKIIKDKRDEVIALTPRGRIRVAVKVVTKKKFKKRFAERVAEISPEEAELVEKLKLSKIIEDRIDWLKDRRTITSDIAEDIKVLESAQKSGKLSRLRSATATKVKPKKKELSDIVRVPPGDGIIIGYVESSFPATALAEARGLVIPFVPLPVLGVTSGQVMQKAPISDIARVFFKNPEIEVIDVKKSVRSIVRLKPKGDAKKIREEIIRFTKKPIPDLDKKLLDKLKPKPLTRDEIITKRKLKPDVTPISIVEPIVGLKLDSKLENKLQKKLKITQRIIQKQELEQIKIEKIEERRIANLEAMDLRLRRLLIFRLKRKRKIKRRVIKKVVKKERKIRPRYKPSVTAVFFGLKGKTPPKGKVFTGLEIRRIIAKTKKGEEKLVKKLLKAKKMAMKKKITLLRKLKSAAKRK